MGAPPSLRRLVVGEVVGVRSPQSAFYLWQSHAVSWMRLKRFACVSEVKDPERQVKSIAGLRPLCGEETTPNLSLLSTNIDKGIVGWDQSAASGRESSDSPISSSNF